MKCEEFEQRLNLVLDERRRPECDDELRLHAENCATCRDVSAAYTILLDGFYALTTPEAPADLATRVLDEVTVRPAARRRVAIVSAILATAAAVAVAAYLPWRSETGAGAPVAQAAKAPVKAPQVKAPQIEPSDAPLVASAEPSGAADSKTNDSVMGDSTTGGPTPIDWEELDDLPLVGPVLASMSDNDEKTDPYAALAKGTGQSLASVVLYMPSVGPHGFMAPAASGGGMLPAQFSEELRPVTETMTETINLLLRAVPLTTAPAAPRKAS